MLFQLEDRQLQIYKNFIFIMFSIIISAELFNLENDPLAHLKV